MLIDMLKEGEQKAGVAPSSQPAPFAPADEEVMATFIAKLRQSWEEELRQFLVVIPAKAGTHVAHRHRLRRCDGKGDDGRRRIHLEHLRHPVAARFCQFALRAFRELNPRTPFAINWHIELIAARLVAVRAGRIRRLLVNLPPRHLKPHLASVAFPA
jgi:hypothetical protein